MKRFMWMPFVLFAAFLPPQEEPALEKIRELYARLELAPRDSFLNYAIATIARREGIDLEEEDIKFPLVPAVTGDPARRVDLFRLSSGAAALHESLQLTELLSPGPPLTENRVLLSELEAPDLPSLDFETMLVDSGASEHRPRDMEEAGFIPEDWAYFRFAAGVDLLAFLKEAENWIEHIRIFYGEATFDKNHLWRPFQRLGMPDPRDNEEFYKMLPGPIVLTLSDLFIREGADLTVLLPKGTPSFLFNDERARRDPLVSRHKGEKEGRLFLSTSGKALDKVIALAEGERPEYPEGSLAAAWEFRYMRSLLPGREEAVFIYLSDPFLRRQVGPGLRIKESRRVRCASHLRTIVNGALLFRLEQGKDAKGIQELRDLGYLEEEILQCPHGGNYSLDEGYLADCSVHGRLGALTPLIDLEMERVTDAEAAAYRRFARSYTQLWRRFFDPVGLSISREGASWKLDTVVLPLAQNSLYRNLASLAGGAPLKEEAGWVEPSTVWLLETKVDRSYLEAFDEWIQDFKLIPEEEVRENLYGGFGHRASLGLLDDKMLFDFDLAAFVGEAVQWNLTKDVFLAPLIGAANLPAYVTIPVEDHVKAKAFLEALREGLIKRGSRPEGGSFSLKLGAYSLPAEDEAPEIDVFYFEIFAFKFRIFYALHEDYLVMATRPDVLLRMVDKAVPLEESLSCNMKLSLFPGRWDAIRPDMLISYEEAARKSCHKVLTESEPFEPWGEERKSRALGMASHCPDAGAFERGVGGRLACSIHNTPADPRQNKTPAAKNPTARILEGLEEVTFYLRFTDQGIHSVIRVRR